MSEVLYKATKYMNAEDALSAQEEKPRKGKGRMIHDKTKGARRPGRETDGTIVAPSPRGEGLQASPHLRP